MARTHQRVFGCSAMPRVTMVTSAVFRVHSSQGRKGLVAVLLTPPIPPPRTIKNCPVDLLTYPLPPIPPNPPQDHEQLQDRPAWS
jgi:hypothetical protein